MLTVSIQSGGASNRMGQDKALMPFLGKPLINRVLERVRYLADEVLVTTNRPTEYAFLGVPLFIDVIKDRGALGGLYTALSVAKYPYVAVVACDMPFVNPDILAHCHHLLAEKDIDAVIPRTEHGLEPFHAVYRRLTCLPAVNSALQSGKWRLISWLPEVKTYELSQEEIQPLDPDGIAFWNINTPQEFLQAEQLIKEKRNA
jgi:molybdopterin-guanine dinucleotide biosynthesis protein A